MQKLQINQFGEVQMSHILLKKLGLTKLDGYEFVKPLGGGSALSSLYSDGNNVSVFKFLIAPRSDIERDRFICEYLALKENRFVKGNSVQIDLWGSIFPKDSYPLPRVTHSLKCIDNSIFYFGYKYEEGELLSEYIKNRKFSLDEKITLLHRIASALNYFSHLNLEHRDLHPENILVMSDPDMDSNKEHPSPKIKILDLGYSIDIYGFQHMEFHNQVVEGIKLNLDAVTEDNNKRMLASFTSMPPDFLVKGKNTMNYDSWSFGIFAYSFLFDKQLFANASLEDIYKILNGHFHPLFHNEHAWPLATTNYPLYAILHSLLHTRGEKRSSLGAITKLFHWYRNESERFQERDFIKKVINNDGNDPYHDPRHDMY